MLIGKRQVTFSEKLSSYELYGQSVLFTQYFLILFSAWSYNPKDAVDKLNSAYMRRFPFDQRTSELI